MEALVAIMALAGMLWFWSDGSQAKERAVSAAARGCTDVGVQLLDQTVTLNRLRLGRNALGDRTLMRVYRFEFCTTGSERFSGYVTLHGHAVKHIEFDHPDGKIITSARGA